MNYFWAFVVGGGICVVGQLLIDLTGLTPARILTGYVVAGQRRPHRFAGRRSHRHPHRRPDRCRRRRHHQPCLRRGLLVVREEP